MTLHISKYDTAFSQYISSHTDIISPNVILYFSEYDFIYHVYDYFVCIKSYLTFDFLLWLQYSSHIWRPEYHRDTGMSSFPPEYPSNYTATPWQPTFMVLSFAWANTSHINNPAETVH